MRGSPTDRLPDGACGRNRLRDVGWVLAHYGVGKAQLGLDLVGKLPLDEGNQVVREHRTGEDRIIPTNPFHQVSLLARRRIGAHSFILS